MGKRAAWVAKACLFTALTAALPGLACALGLGQIQSDTRIGQNLAARIPILAADPNVLQGLTVGLASPAAYEGAGLREPDFLFNLKFSIERNASGPYVLVTSTRPVRLPFLNLLVHVHWSSGDVTRQYTLLLNPPVFAANRTGTAVATPSVPVRRAPIERPEPPPVYGQAQPRRSLAVTPARAGSYGPVRSGQTLWSIASRLRPDGGISVNQMMIALYRANPQAFSGNINRLKAGATLRVPSRGEIGRTSPAAAEALAARQSAAWQDKKAGGAATGGEARMTKTTVPAEPANHPDHAAGKAPEPVATPRAGKVVLTAPHITRFAGAKGAAPETAASAVKAGGAPVAAAGAPSRKAVAGKTARASTLPAASTGGPAKIRDAELANLATAKRAAAKKQPAAAGKEAKTPAPKTVNPATDGQTGNAVWNWFTTPKGWVVMAVIALFLILLAFLFGRRTGTRSIASAQPATETDPETLAPVTGLAHADANVPEAAEREAATIHAEPAATAASAEHAAAGTGAGGAVVPKAEFAAYEFDRADALLEADLSSGSGDHAGAARVLSAALEQEPARKDLRRRLLEELFAAGATQAFRREAEELHGRIPVESAAWQAVAVMGRQLLPADPLFFEAEAAGGEPSGGEKDADALDFDFEPIQLGAGRSTGDVQNKVEGGFGQLSRMIETYLPVDPGPAPDRRPSSGETGAPAGKSPQAEEDEAIEFEPPDDLPRAAESGMPFEEESSFPPEEMEAVEAEADAWIRLDLARAYLEMGDPESARGILEEILDDGDEVERQAARELLATLGA